MHSIPASTENENPSLASPSSASPTIVGTLVRKIISGGQTGVDRGALIAAIELGIEHGGRCPRGRLAEDGPIDARFQLIETESSAYHVRTQSNVLESCGTLILHRGPLVGGTALTETFALRHQRPCLKIDFREPQPPVRVEVIRAWLRKHRIAVLNIAGPRESSQPGITEETRQLVHDLATGAFTVRRVRGSLESVATPASAGIPLKKGSGTSP
ncbi:MAG: putative molybdenum carrier protein [Pirellulaceae bacterium]